MHHQPRNDTTMMALGRPPATGAALRHAFHRTARRHRMRPKHLSALIAQANRPDGGAA
jgi:hypothetical protein